MKQHTFDISPRLTRKDCDEFLERLTPFLDLTSRARPLSEVSFEGNQYCRDTYLNTHEVIVMQFGANTSYFLDAVANAIVDAKIGKNSTSYCAAAYAQYLQAFDTYERLA